MDTGSHTLIPSPSPVATIQNLVGPASENDEILESLGTVLDKIQMIAQVTIRVVDTLTKVSQLIMTATWALR